MHLVISRRVSHLITGFSLAACSITPALAEASASNPTQAPALAASTQTASPVPAPSSRPFTMECTSGTKVQGLVDRWSPLSTCPKGFHVTGLGRIDLQGDHNRPNLHVNDFICDDRGCKAWCIGDGCTVEARCCRLSESDPQ